MAIKQDSNLTGLRIAEEQSLKVLPVTPVWYPLEPNSYSDFGGTIATVARNPINASRQLKKGVTTDLDASGGFNQDLTLKNMTRLLQGFFFADIREKKTNMPMNSAALPITSVTSGPNSYNAAAGLAGAIVGSLIFAQGFNVAANNGLKTLASNSTATAFVTTEATAAEASPPNTAEVQVVGYQFLTAVAAIALNGDLVRLTSSGIDLQTLGLILGEWIFIGGDTVGSNRFANNVGFARISAIAAGYLEFDKVSWATPIAEASTGKTIRIFFGDLIRNEKDPALIKRRTYQLERTLGNDGNGVMSEYLVGAVANEITFNVPQADKVNMDLSFIALDNEQRTGTVGPKTGTKPDLLPESAFNTSTDLKIKLASVSSIDATIDPLYAFASTMTLTINNGVTALKALGVLGGFETAAGNFTVSGSIEAYFADLLAVQAVRNNSDITLDFLLQKLNAALLFDIPLLSLGGGRLNVTSDAPITLPVDTNAAEGKFGSTATVMFFSYLPSIAGGV